MILSWMLYGAAVSALVAAGASAAEALGRLTGYPRALDLGRRDRADARAACAGTGPARGRAARSAPALPIGNGRGASTSTMAGRVRPNAAGASRRRAPRARHATRRSGPSRLALRRLVGRSLAGRLDAHLPLCSSVSLVGGQARIRRARRRWPLTRHAGTRVRVAPAIPVLSSIGVPRPEIVVPRWLLARPPHEQRLVIAHEAEHVAGRSTRCSLPRAVSPSCSFPWCPALWYMFSRLRLAVELDCDARVLRAGAAPRSYGALLIDVAEQSDGIPSRRDRVWCRSIPPSKETHGHETHRPTICSSRAALPRSALSARIARRVRSEAADRGGRRCRWMRARRSRRRSGWS